MKRILFLIYFCGVFIYNILFSLKKLYDLEFFSEIPSSLLIIFQKAFLLFNLWLFILLNFIFLLICLFYLFFSYFAKKWKVLVSIFLFLSLFLFLTNCAFLLEILPQIPLFVGVFFISVVTTSIIYLISHLSESILWNLAIKIFPISNYSLKVAQSLLEKGKLSFFNKRKLMLKDTFLKKNILFSLSPNEFKKLDKSEQKKILKFLFDYNKCTKLISLFEESLIQEPEKNPDEMKFYFICLLKLNKRNKIYELLNSRIGEIINSQMDTSLARELVLFYYKNEEWENLTRFLQNFDEIIGRKYLLDFLKSLLSKLVKNKKYEILYEMLRKYRDILPEYTYLFYLKKIEKNAHHIKVERDFIDYTLRKKNILKMLRYIKKYFFSRQKFDFDYYELWKRYKEITKEEFEKLIELYPDKYILYKDYEKILSPKEKRKLKEKIEKLTLSKDQKIKFSNLVKKIETEITREELKELKEKILKEKEPTSLKNYLEKLLQLDEKNEINYLLEYLNIEIIQNKKIEKILWELISTYSNTFLIMDYLGNFYLKMKYYDKYISLVKKASKHTLEPINFLYEKLHPLVNHVKNKEIYEIMGDYHFQKKEYGKALQFYKIALEIDNDENIFFKYLLSLKKGKKEIYLKKLNEIIKKDDEKLIKYLLNTEICEDIFSLMFEKNKFDKLYEYIEKYIKETGKKAELLLKVKKKENEYLKKFYEMKLKEEPKNVEPAFKLGLLYLEEKNYDKSFIYFQKCFKSEKYKYRAWAYGAYVLMHKGLWDIAMELVEKIKLDELDPHSEELEEIKNILYEIGTLFDEEKEYENSIKIYMQIFKVDANFRNVMKKIELYDIYMKTKKKIE